MKTKARDIIPGWPRPRSTIAPISYQGWDWIMFRALRLRVPFMCSLTELKQYRKDYAMYNDDFIYEETYHQLQQDMVNEWFARYRLGDLIFQKQAYPNVFSKDQVKKLEDQGILIWHNFNLWVSQ